MSKPEKNASQEAIAEKIVEALKGASMKDAIAIISMAKSKILEISKV